MKPAGLREKELFFGMISSRTVSHRIAARHGDAIDTGVLAGSSFEMAVAEQKSKVAVLQIILVIFLDCIAHKGDADFVGRTLPSGSGVVEAEKPGLADLRIGKRFLLVVVPAEAACDTEVVGDLLLVVPFARDRR